MNSERFRQVEELYQSAWERAPADRAALLAQADPELRREVEALLAQDGSGGKILDGRAEDLLTDSRLTMVVDGSQLGPYQIEALLGAGGMARSTARSTPVSTAKSPSRSPLRSSAHASSARRAPLRR